MKITRFEIRKYRAIENVELSLNSSMIPIIGVNESGKTSVLNAILAFDKTRDHFKGGDHLNFRNNYYTSETTGSSVSAVMLLTKSELGEMIKSIGVSTDSPDYKILDQLNSRTELKLTRSLSDLDYSVSIEGLSEKARRSVTNYLYKLFPYILYFDDFTDRVPDEIPIPTDYLPKKGSRKSSLTEWREIIYEIFKRASTDMDDADSNPLKSYLQHESRTIKEDILSDIEAELNKEIISEWKRIKKSGKALADDSDKLALTISNENDTFMFKVKDMSREDSKKRTFSVSERSKGFQWFFNYMIKLKYNPNYNKDMDKSLFLLDEPGSYLHSAAQSELLKELKRVSRKNTIIYCTHSQFLLNPNDINLGSIRIASKKKSKVTLQEFGRYKEKKTTGALSPVHQALHLNYSPDFSGKAVITEGVTDFYLFTMLQRHTDLVPKDIKFLPGSGAKQLSTMISFCLSFADSFRVFLDNDDEGRSAKSKYIDEFGDAIEQFIHVYHDDEVKFQLEDFLSKSDKKSLKEITNCSDIKRAIGFLFYDYRTEQKEYFNSLTEKTLRRIEECSNVF